MIVRDLDGTLELITQPDHAHLAERIMSRCNELSRHPRAASILRAVREHDNGWVEEDALPRIDPDTGRVVDFISAPAATRQGVWPRGVSRVADPWSAALVAQHAITVYDRYRDHPDWLQFFAEMHKIRDREVRGSGGALDDLLADYTWVRLGDLVSLVFCTNWIEEQQFGEWAVGYDGTRVRVRPDPFGGREVPFQISARRVRSMRFGSDRELQDALRHAPTILLTGAAVGARHDARSG